jgi:phenylpropionate dioxygenase-like ring-hydroxylating dioxygenase large terminal subunit
MDSIPNIHSYFDPEYQSKEINSLFKDIRYSGHKLMVPNSNDYRVLETSKDRWALFNREGKYVLQSNVCLHRQSKLLEGSGNTKLTSCRVHCWTYDTEGKLKSAPHFKNKPDVGLKTAELNEWNGLLFEGRVPSLDLEKCGISEYINFDDYMFSGSSTTEYNYNWKTFSEIYLENYHVFSMHPGLRKFVSPTDLEWHFGDDYSVQKVGLGDNLLNSGSFEYMKWQMSVAKAHNGNLPRYGAIWIYLYPNIMIEWYPNVIAISTVYPETPQKCVNHVEFYFKPKIFQELPEYYTNFNSIYNETAAEDEEACLLLDSGRASLYARGENETGYCEPFLEAGVQHFYDWMKKKIGTAPERFQF